MGRGSVSRELAAKDLGTPSRGHVRRCQSRERLIDREQSPVWAVIDDSSEVGGREFRARSMTVRRGVVTRNPSTVVMSDSGMSS